MASASASSSSTSRSTSTCSPVIRPLMRNTTKFSALTTRSILQLIVGFRFNPSIPLASRSGLRRTGFVKHLSGCSDYVVRSRDRLRVSKARASFKSMKTKENSNISSSLSRESREFREIPRIPRIGVLKHPSGRPLAEFELLFVDFQGLDPGLQGRWWNPKLGRCPRRSRNPASSLSERRLDNLPLASWLSIQCR
jgi:hypothetical protein